MLDVSPGDVISDRYEVERELGKGGMATVYQVRHKELKSRHALKLLDISSSSVRKRLLQEGRIQASLAHPHIVAVTDVLDVDGSPGLVMEFVDGQTLADLLAEGPPDLADAERWFRSILNAVGYAHSRGLVHRDLKPENVLMARLDDDLHPKVADFGIAKVLGELGGPDQPGTRAGMAMGTPAYMPPEQVNSAADADQRADVFALGCILYELVTGQRAFPSENVLSVFTAVLKGEYIAATDLVPDLEPRIVTAIERALDPDRSTRTQTVSEFLAILDARLTPVARPRPAPAPAAPVELRGRPEAVVGAAAAMVAVVSITGAAAVAVGILAGWASYLLLMPAVAVPMVAQHRPTPSPPPAASPPPELRAPPVRRTAEQPPPLSLSIASWHQLDRTRNGVMKYAPDDGQLLIADVELANLTDETLDLGFPWTLIGPDGAEYDAPLGCHQALEGSIDPFGDLDPGATVKGPLCFDGPHEVSGGRIRFQGAHDDLAIEFPL